MITRTDDTVTLNWNEPTTPNGVIHYYIVSIGVEGDSSVTEYNTTSTEVSLPLNINDLGWYTSIMHLLLHACVCMHVHYFFCIHMHSYAVPGTTYNVSVTPVNGAGRGEIAIYTVEGIDYIDGN